MSIERKLVQTFEEDYQCDKCHAGYMRHTGIVLDSYPPIYPHVCNNSGCDNTLNFNFAYPRVIHQAEPAS